MDKRICRCGAEFQPTHGKNIYCSPGCRQPNHAKVTLTCDCCGGPAVKYRRTKQRYANTYCGRLCRDYAKYGATSSTIPRDHWARWYGRTSAWSKPVRTTRVFFSNTCNDCDRAFVEIAYGVPSDYCSPTCSKRVARRRRRAREHQAPGSFTYSQVMRQYARQGNTCAYCKQPAAGLPDPEHVTPLSRGGRNDMSNLVASCRPCNTDKGDLSLEEWAPDRVRRGLEPVDTTLTGSEFMHLMRTEPSRPAWRDNPTNIYSKVA